MRVFVYVYVCVRVVCVLVNESQKKGLLRQHTRGVEAVRGGAGGQMAHGRHGAGPMRRHVTPHGYHVTCNL
mgnify:CR=1 FL=1